MKKFLLIICLSILLSGNLVIAETNDTTAENMYFVSVASSKLIKFGYDIVNMAVGNPDIADVLLTSKREILINGKNPGLTTLTLWNNNKTQEYKIAVVKNSADITFKKYKLSNLSLVSHTIEDFDKMMILKNEPFKETVKNLESILSSYLEPTRFAVDPWTNSIMVIGSPQDHQQIEMLLADLDKKDKQVVFKVEVYELKLENTLKNDLNLLYQRGQGTTAYNKAADGLSYTYSSGADFAESATHIFKTLLIDGKAKIIANPKIQTLNNRYSFMHAGEKFPLVQKDAQGNPTVEYIYYGVILGVIPNIDQENNINCWISTQVSSISGYSPTNGYPNITTRQTVNEVRIKDQGLLILGGLLKETENKNEYKIPIIGDLLGWVPILGSIVKNENTEKITTELVVTLRPEVVNDDTLTAEVK